MFRLYSHHQTHHHVATLHFISVPFSFEYFRDDVPNDGRAAEHVA